MAEIASTSNSELPQSNPGLPRTHTIPISPPRPSKKPRRQLSNAQRAEIRRYFYDDSHTKPTQDQVIQWFETKYYHKLTQPQVSKILSEQYSFLDGEKWQEKRRNKSAEHPDLEDMLHHWEQAANRSGRLTVTGEILQQMAVKFWHLLPQYSSLEPPKFSTGWLTGFKARYNIKRRRKHGEAAEVDKMQMELDLAEIRDICALYSLPDIFNMDETALNYKASPDSSLSSESVPGSKINKERITANFCCNADGSQKLDPWFIGTAKNPRSFGVGKNHIEVHNLGLVWRANKKAWMTGPLFQEYLRWFNLQMAGRKVLLLLDGFSAHRAGITLLETKEIELQNVRIEFLPANTTSVCQPLDQGIIRTFKAHYKRRWLQYQLDNYEAGEDPHKKMNVLQALRWVTEAWRDGVTETTVANCWLKSRVLEGQMTPPTKRQAQQMGWHEAVRQDEASYIQTVNLARQAIQELEKRHFIKEGQHVDAFLNPPDEIIADSPDEDQFIEQLAQSYAKGPEVDPDGTEVPVPELISIPQALEAAKTLRAFGEQQKEDYRGLIRQLAVVERDIRALQVANSTQTTLDSFFAAQ